MAVLAVATLLAAASVHASDFSRPWKRLDRALVLDAYEYNSIDWKKMTRDKRIVGFINKGSDGLPPAYRCSGNATQLRLCRALWRRYSVARELYQTRKTIAKSLGLKWGAYHLGRPGNPIAQAEHFIEFTKPDPDDLIAIDIEEDDPEKWLSLEDAELFAKHIYRRLGRYPLLYTNGSTARAIAKRRHELPLLSRLPLWYARYIPEIDRFFPKGHWANYSLWQFNSQANCSRRSCPYRVAGTPLDIDVNVAPMTVEELRAVWPFGGLVGSGAVMLASIPVPISRERALEGGTRLRFLPVKRQTPVMVLAEQYRLAGDRSQPEPATGAVLAALTQAKRRAEIRPGDGSRAHPASISQTLADGVDYAVQIQLASEFTSDGPKESDVLLALAQSYRDARYHRAAPASPDIAGTSMAATNTVPASGETENAVPPELVTAYSLAGYRQPRKTDSLAVATSSSNSRYGFATNRTMETEDITVPAGETARPEMAINVASVFAQDRFELADCTLPQSPALAGGINTCGILSRYIKPFGLNAPATPACRVVQAICSTRLDIGSPRRSAF